VQITSDLSACSRNVGVTCCKKFGGCVFQFEVATGLATLPALHIVEFRDDVGLDSPQVGVVSAEGEEFIV
jgi:hypothetical protein